MQSQGSPVQLPALRQDLQLLEGAQTVTGTPTWLVFDPVMHRYFQIDQSMFRLLGLWRSHHDAQGLLEAARHDEGVLGAERALTELVKFLVDNNLVAEAARGWRHYADRADRRSRGIWSWLVHGYLFIKVPLIRPHRFLKRIEPLFAPLFSPAIFWIVALFSMVGIYLVTRQWETFLSTFHDFFSLEGIAVYLLVLGLIKIVHEFAHALTATRFGCRVPTMGLAFLVMFPVLYTDVTDAWRLKSRRQRILIAAAGMIVELAIAGLATFAWVFLPDGTARSLAFVVATVSWTMSLLINLNPLMRFDGYYLLADALGIENLQPRAFAFGRWRLHELLFGLGRPAPEPMPGSMRQILTVYAWATWIYRFFLFVGIALLVYAFFFKVLGLALFVVEVIWFIARPLWSEIREWITMRHQIVRSWRSWVSLVVLATITGLCAVPLSTSVSVPAVIDSARTKRIFADSPSRVERVLVKPGDRVVAGQPLVELSSTQIGKELRLATIELDIVNRRLARSPTDALDRSQILVLQREKKLLTGKISGLQRRRDLLTVTAPFAGRIVDFNPALHRGRWVPREEALFTVIDNSDYRARGYVAEADLWRIANGASGQFIPDDLQRSSLAVVVEDIAIANSPVLQISELASTYGGRIAVRDKQQTGLVPVEAQYLVAMQVPGEHAAGDQLFRGLVRLEGRPESILARVWRRSLQVLVRESGV